MKIVVVEDEKPIREGLVKILGKMNKEYVITGSASNGRKGLELIRKVHPDLIFLDIQMPEMDGLELLHTIREEGIDARVIILTAYSDFKYAKEAITLGIDNYLLKPIHLGELKKILDKMEQVLTVKKQERQMLSLENLFYGIMQDRISIDENLEGILESHYGLKLEEPVHCLFVFSGKSYEENKKEILDFFCEMQKHKMDYSMCLLCMEKEQACLVIFYHVDREYFQEFVKNSVLPALKTRVKKIPVFVWKTCGNLKELVGAEEAMKKTLKWNLICQSGELLLCDEIEKTDTCELQYPMEVEVQARQAIIRADKEQFVRCWKLFTEACLEKKHRPESIREACIRYAYAVIHTAKECGIFAGESVSMQQILQTIMESVSRDEIREALMGAFSRIHTGEQEEDAGATQLLVKKAQGMIQEYYAQGINLEEVARRLHVSEEYLSKQFKKETGVSFSETIKKYRIDQVKRLLIDSDLKLNQIASMTGYSDPKYMSQVFRAETGMLPGEYRRIHG